jgi:hypothetical protein
LNRKGQVGLIEVDAATLPRWLLYPLVILICLVLLAVVFFLSIIGYSCLKGNCNTYYGMGWFGYRYYPLVQFQQTNSQECYTNGIRVNCSEVKFAGPA